MHREPLSTKMTKKCKPKVELTWFLPHISEWTNSNGDGAPLLVLSERGMIVFPYLTMS